MGKDEDENCQLCYGAGKIIDPSVTHDDDIVSDENTRLYTCPRCGGTGKAKDQKPPPKPLW